MCKHQWIRVRDIGKETGETYVYGIKIYDYGALVQCAECMDTKELWGLR